MRGLLLGAAGSGAGKTTVAAALCAALRRRGLAVAPFKVGPDFLDPTHLAAAAGRPCHTLDPYLMDDAALRARAARGAAGADLVVVEGMMGLFDGVDARSDAGSAADVARRLGLPVVLVVDASTAARSVAALVHGFATFDRDLHLAGVVATRVGGPGHAALLREALASSGGPPLLGALPFDGEIAVPERYLGLHAAAETDPSRAGRLADLAERHLDLERLSRLETAPGRWPADPRREAPAGPPRSADPSGGARVGVARDEAFAFYYPANLERLDEAGARVVPFSPLADRRLPDVDALYLGGGYPERHAAALEANAPMRAAVRAFVERGGTVYAECGGLLYLADRLVDAEGRAHQMAGALPGAVAVMTGGLVDFGYVAVETTRPTLLGPPGTRVHGHRFHVSRLASPPAGALLAYALSRPDGTPWGEEGFVIGRVLASYVHLNFDGAPGVAEALARARRP
ncbi:MAG TPA: cobyrinate a,c-diamide synthase [Thermodesulfobacteriota bacterium]